MQRFQNLETLRAVAAISVLLGHAYALGPDGVPLASATLHGSLLASSTAGVWLFFALSGFVISRPYVRAVLSGAPLPGWSSYVVRRAARIFPLYWLALAIAVITLGTRGASWWELGFHVGLLHNLVPGRQGEIVFAAWTLTLEVLFYAFVPAVAVLVRRRSRQPVTATRLTIWVLLAWGASVGFGLLGALVHDADGEPSLFLRQLFPAMLAAFCPGILLAIAEASDGPGRRFLDGVRRHRGAAVAVVAVLLVLGVATAWVEPGQTVEAVRRWLVVLTLGRQVFVVAFGLLLAVTITTREWQGMPARLGAWLGQLSYGIYLLHAVALYWLERHPRFIVLPESGWFPYLVHVAQLGAIALFLAWCSWHLLEQPAMRAARRRAGARREPAPVP